MYIKIFTQFLLWINLFAISNGMECNPHGSCGCLLEDGSKSIDLTPLVKASGHNPMFNLSDSGIKYSVDLCNSFKCGGQKAKICYVFSSTLGISFGNDLTYDYKDSSGVVTFVYAAETGTTRVTMHCSSGGGLGSFTPIANSKQDLYTTTFTSKYACFINHKAGDKGSSGSHKLSIGSIICIGVLVLMIVYFVGGVLINKYVRKVEDSDYVPNKEFWKALPSYIKDGCSFSINKVRKKNRDYEKI